MWCRVALLSFGGPAGQIAVMHRILVDEKRWIGEQRFLHALNFCMLAAVGKYHWLVAVFRYKVGSYRCWRAVRRRDWDGAFSKDDSQSTAKSTAKLTAKSTALTANCPPQAPGHRACRGPASPYAAPTFSAGNKHR